MYNLGVDQENEKLLIDRVLQGEAGAVREFYSFYKIRVWQFIRKKTQSDLDAQEILQDTFLSAVESLPLFSGRSKVSTWLCGIAFHEVCDYYRKKRIKALVLSQMPILEQFLTDDANLEEQYDKQELSLAIENTLMKILPRYAHVLRKKYLEGWSVAEIADSLGESLKATETALYRARSAFAVAWEAEAVYEKRR